MSRWMTVIGLVVCGLALCAFGTASAAAAPAQVYECDEEFFHEGMFLDSHCTEESFTWEGGWETYALGSTSVAATGTATGGSRISAFIGGIKFEVECPEMMSTAGTAANVGGSAVGAGIVLHYTGCVVLNPEPTKCKVESETVSTVPLGATVNMTSASETLVTFKPESGVTIAVITFQNCGTKAFNGSKSVTGGAVGVVSASAPGKLVFSGTAGGGLKYAGQTATFESSNHATGPNGGTLAVETP